MKALYEEKKVTELKKDLEEIEIMILTNLLSMLVTLNKHTGQRKNKNIVNEQIIALIAPTNDNGDVKSKDYKFALDIISYPAEYLEFIEKGKNE